MGGIGASAVIGPLLVVLFGGGGTNAGEEGDEEGDGDGDEVGDVSDDTESMTGYGISRTFTSPSIHAATLRSAVRISRTPAQEFPETPRLPSSEILSWRHKSR